VVATFCHKLAQHETPVIDTDGDLKLIYIGELVNAMFAEIRSKEGKPEVIVKHSSESKVSELLLILESYKKQYHDNGIIPSIANTFALNFFNTFRCFIHIATHFPVKFVEHKDPRGSFEEIIRFGVDGQVSFSTTFSGTTIGNHIFIINESVIL